MTGEAVTSCAECGFDPAPWTEQDIERTLVHVDDLLELAHERRGLFTGFQIGLRHDLGQSHTRAVVVYYIGSLGAVLLEVQGRDSDCVVINLDFT